jgi:hypothetical protein
MLSAQTKDEVPADSSSAQQVTVVFLKPYFKQMTAKAMRQLQQHGLTPESTFFVDLFCILLLHACHCRCDSFHYCSCCHHHNHCSSREEATTTTALHHQISRKRRRRKSMK